MKNIYILLMLLSMTACSLIPSYQRPPMPGTDKWQREKIATVSDLSRWWEKFNSVELLALQNRAMQQNLDLRAALARVDQARAEAKIVGADLYPSADLSASASGTLSKTAGRDTRYRPAASGSLDISYELDLFGSNRASKAAAEAGVKSSIYDHKALSLVVSADVAKAYAAILTLKGRVYVAENNRATLVKTLDIIRARMEAGAASALELEQQKAEVANADAGIASLRNSMQISLTALAVLLGEPPQDFRLRENSLGNLNVPEISPGQPSTLLSRRPDIRKAEADLIAANANIGVARSAFFPTINLGLAPSITASPLASPAVSALALSSSLTMPLFSAGSISANVEKTKARQRELAENYRKTVLTAFKEVEDALAAVKSADKRRVAYLEAVHAATKAHGIAEQQFKAGAIDYTALLTAERSLLAAKDNLVSVNLERLTAAIDLYKALGGGWKS